MQTRIAKWMCAATALIVILAGCGGSDDGGGSGNVGGEPIETAGAKATSQVIEITQLGLSMAANPGGPFQRRVLRNESRGSLRSSLAGVRKLNARVPAAVAMQAVTSDCNISGTKTIDLSTGTSIYAECVDGDASSQTYQDGVEQITVTNTTMTSKMGSPTEPYVFRETIDGVLVSEFSAQFEFTAVESGTPVTCGSNMVYPNLHSEMSGMVSFKSDDDVDGSLDEDYELIMTNVVMHGTDDTLDPKTCEATSGTLTESGGFDATDNLDVANSVSMTISDETPLTMTWSEADGTETVSIAGTMMLTSACFNGTITIQTLEPIVTKMGADCATAGKIKVTGDVVATVTYTSAGGLTIDSGSDGTVDETFGSCLDAAACI